MTFVFFLRTPGKYLTIYIDKGAANNDRYNIFIYNLDDTKYLAEIYTHTAQIYKMIFCIEIPVFIAFS